MHDGDYEQTSNNKPTSFNHAEVHDLIRDLGLPKDEAKHLASRLKKECS